MSFAQVLFYERLGKQSLEMFNLDRRQWRGPRVLDCPWGPGSLSAVLRVSRCAVRLYPAYTIAPTPLRRSLPPVPTTRVTMVSPRCSNLSEIAWGSPVHRDFLMAPLETYGSHD